MQIVFWVIYEKHETFQRLDEYILVPIKVLAKDIRG